jgi:hypothetical protein
MNRRKGLQKSLVIRDNRGHLGLLEHALRNPDSIGITGFSPGEISAVLFKPMKQKVLDSFYPEDGDH